MQKDKLKRAPYQSFTFTKQERLKSRKLIGLLFTSGKSKVIFPLKFTWIQTDLYSTYPVQFTVSVPKRRFNKAVDRNRLKRQIREAYRVHKSSLYEELQTKQEQYALIVTYISNEMLPYQEIEEKIAIFINRFWEYQKKQ